MEKFEVSSFFLASKVAEHINEMQRIHEEYGAIFDHLFRQHQKSSKQVRQRTELRTQFSLPDHQCVHKNVQKYFPLLHFQPIDLSPGDLLYYGGVEWLNISDFLGKIKKVKIEKRRLTITQQENNSINKIVCLP